MSLRVRSSLFVAGHIITSGGSDVVAQVDPGDRWLVKGVQVVNQNNATVVCSLLAYDPVGHINHHWFMYKQTMAVDSAFTDRFAAMAVMQEGDQLIIATDGGGYDMQLSCWGMLFTAD